MATKKKNNPIKEYTKKDGSTAYMFKKYLGIDPLTGKQRETTRRGFTSSKEAKLALARLEIEVAEEGLKDKPKSRTYQEVAEDWFELIYKEKVKESTYWNTHLLFEKHILPAFGAYKIDRITVTACQKQANKWAKESPKRHQRYINYAGMIFKYAASVGDIKKNPMGKITMPTVDEEHDPNEPENFYDREQLLDFLERLKAGFPYKRYAFFTLLAYTGLRKGEALVLTWRDIDFKQKTITINKTQAVGENGKLLVQVPKTKASNRIISIDNATIEVLKEWRNIQSNDLKKLGYMASVNQLVFSKIDDNSYMYPRTPLSWLDSFYNKNKDMKRITVHGFRHSHASLLFAAGIDIKYVQYRLGHSNIKTTYSIYVHVTKEAKEETAELFSDYMKNGKNLGQSLGQKKNPAQ
ncbi:tyrosine-type recombinase/integrase [Enterococcus canintestini]|uniref:tyrosine-type recombinase/integrase n=1 Tax=Enterococcus canintestini TaxID=317010 RepID=UPI00288FAB96|nr:tyrosine-type recombinase/integrase [Enterococcus canintestini]MDT2738890.1 tyrosine-type recombinase/integrase [Enterococcus canintestini]